MPEQWPVPIRTPEGDSVEVDVTPSGRVYLWTSYQGAWLSAAQREEFSRAWIAACWVAEGRVTAMASGHTMHCQCAEARRARRETGASDG